MSKIKKWFDKTNKFDLLGYLLLIICAIIYWICHRLMYII